MRTTALHALSGGATSRSVSQNANHLSVWRRRSIRHESQYRLTMLEKIPDVVARHACREKSDGVQWGSGARLDGTRAPQYGKEGQC